MTSGLNVKLGSGHVHPPRVAVVTSRLDLGGTEGHLARVVPELRRRGIDITLYLMERGGSLERELLDQGVRLEGPRRKNPGLLHWARATAGLALWLRRERPTIVHFFLTRPYIYGSLAAEFAGHRRRIMSRRSLNNYRARYPFVGSVERFLHRRTIGLIGNSRAVLDQLGTEVGDSNKLALIHNGVKIPEPIVAFERQRPRHSLGIPDDALVIVVVANLLPYKGHEDLIEALALLRDKLLRPWVLLAIGRDDGIGDQLRQQAKALDLESKIIWLGEQGAVDQLLRGSDIFVLPSREEGFSNALLEAMAVGLPVIATAVGGNLDAIIDNESGILTPPGNPRELAAAILRLANDANLRRNFAAEARLRARENFSFEACVRQYEKLYWAMNEPKPKCIAEILLDDSQ
ncbi:MAG TPA: glycosyltransferase [Xanthobacteraceae bacterium]|nr:glycosyltransferase [Xanthobacteraceae bacterium]